MYDVVILKAVSVLDLWIPNFISFSDDYFSLLSGIVLRSISFLRQAVLPWNDFDNVDGLCFDIPSLIL